MWQYSISTANTYTDVTHAFHTERSEEHSTKRPHFILAVRTKRKTLYHETRICHAPSRQVHIRQPQCTRWVFQWLTQSKCRKRDLKKRRRLAGGRHERWSLVAAAVSPDATERCAGLAVAVTSHGEAQISVGQNAITHHIGNLCRWHQKSVWVLR